MRVKDRDIFHHHKINSTRDNGRKREMIEVVMTKTEREIGMETQNADPFHLGIMTEIGNRREGQKAVHLFGRKGVSLQSGDEKIDRQSEIKEADHRFATESHQS